MHILCLHWNSHIFSSVVCCKCIQCRVGLGIAMWARCCHTPLLIIHWSRPFLSATCPLISCCCQPTPKTLASGGSPMFPLVVHQIASPSIWAAVQSHQRGLSTNPGATMWCVCAWSPLPLHRTALGWKYVYIYQAVLSWLQTVSSWGMLAYTSLLMFGGTIPVNK